MIDVEMTQTAPSHAICPACGKQYRTKPEQAGKRLKCTCGTLFTAPSAPSPTPVLGYKTPGSSSAIANEYFPDKVKDFQIPLVILCAGIVIEFISGSLSRTGTISAALS